MDLSKKEALAAEAHGDIQVLRRSFVRGKDSRNSLGGLRPLSDALVFTVVTHTLHPMQRQLAFPLAGG